MTAQQQRQSNHHPINPANVADYREILKSKHDGCQWNPEEQRGSLVSDAHWRQTRAAFIVGGSIHYRICIDCAASLKWSVHQRKPIR
jgi:hypothetical protein